jgi:hypothetical protein
VEELLPSKYKALSSNPILQKKKKKKEKVIKEMQMKTMRCHFLLTK